MPYPKTLVLKISDPAKLDLQDIIQYTFEHYGEAQVETYLQALYDGMGLLCKNPAIGHSRDDIPVGYELFGIEKHLLLFTATDDELIIARILHHSMDIKRHF